MNYQLLISNQLKILVYYFLILFSAVFFHLSDQLTESRCFAH